MNILIPHFSSIKEELDDTYNIERDVKESLKCIEFYLNIKETNLSITATTLYSHTNKQLNTEKVTYNPKLFTKTELPDGTLKFELNTNRIEEYLEELGVSYILRLKGYVPGNPLASLYNAKTTELKFNNFKEVIDKIKQTKPYEFSSYSVYFKLESLLLRIQLV